MKPSKQDIRQEVEEVIAERQDSFEDEEKEEIIEKVVERIEDKDEDSVEAPNDNDIDRRSFLKMMGLGAGGLAFSSMASAEFFKLGSGGSGGSQNLSSVLSEGNSAGSYNINMNGSDINDVNSISGSPDGDLMYFTPGAKGDYTVRYDTDDFRFYNGGSGGVGNIMYIRHGGPVEVKNSAFDLDDNRSIRLGNNNDFGMEYETSSDEFVLYNPGGVDLIRQPKSGATKFVQGADTGPIEAPGDSLTQLINSSATSSSASGDPVGYTLAVDNRSFISVNAESDGSGGIQNEVVEVKNAKFGLPLFTSDPSANPGEMWYRSDLD